MTSTTIQSTATQPTYESIMRMIHEDRIESQARIREIDRLGAEVRRELAESAYHIKEMSKKIGALGNRLGDFVQEMVRPAVVRLFQEQGIEVHEVHPNISVNRGGEGIEVDLFVVDDRQAIAIECKSHATVDDIKEHLERLGKFKKFFPRYRDVELMGAVAAMVMPDEVAKYAYRQGLYVLAQNGEMVEVRNDERFKAVFVNTVVRLTSLVNYQVSALSRGSPWGG